MKLSPVTETAWNVFEANCNWINPHPLDLERFDHFIVRAHRTGDDVDIGKLISSTPADESVAEQLRTRFRAGLEILKVNASLP